MRRTFDNNNGVIFEYRGIKNQKGICEIYIDKNGNADFYWGELGNPTSASFSADSVSVDTVKNIISPDFIDTIRSLSSGFKLDTTSYYFMGIREKGKINYNTYFDKSYIEMRKYGANRLSRLIKMIDTFYNRYAFPK